MARGNTTSGRGPQRDPVMSGTLVIGRISGIEIGVHYTWLLIFALITFSLGVGYYPLIVPGLAPSTYWGLGAASALLLFLSVLIHELSHSILAQRRGLPVRGITLFIFGGVSSIEQEATSPRDEFWISFVGPLSSLILAGVFFGLSFLAAGGSVVSALLSYLATINLALAIFNLLPGFPLDGGRVLRAIIWAVTGDHRKATNWAAAVGHLLAFLLIAFGFIQILEGNWLGGIWTAFIGWFLNGAADSSRQAVSASETFQGVRVEALMDPDPPTVDAQATVQEVVDQHILGHGRRAILVEQDGRLAGIVSLTDVRELSQASWPDTTVGAIMTRSPLIGVQADESARRAADLLAEHDVNQLVVFDDGEPVGMLSRGSLIRYLRYRDELGLRPIPGGKRQPGDVGRKAA